MNYKLAYRIGFHPWEEAVDMAPFVEKISALFARDENGHEPPYGRALDLGCGSGIWGIELARRGWQVTGVDNAAKALERAHERVREAGVEMPIVNGDVTRLRDAGIEPGFRLILDTGTFHGLGPGQREAMGREVNAIAAADATVLVVAWNPRRRGPFPRGVSQAEIESAFPGWTVTDEGPSEFAAPKPLMAEETWYRLERSSR
jgi:cyclopropane fatty-acyl-phospholipid synthase-like methyltransferase